MPRDGSGQYHVPVGTDGVTDTTIESSKYNLYVHDVETDLNSPRPISAGGTGADNAVDAMIALGGETAKQVVTNWDSTVWLPGSFYADSSASGIAPVAGHAFAGIAYYANASDFVLEATDLTVAPNPAQYIRTMTSGVWGSWMMTGNGAPVINEYAFDGTLTFPPAAGQIRFNNATQNSTTEVFISHLTSYGIDNTGAVSLSVRAGGELLIQDKDEPTKYKIFTVIAPPVLSGGDFRISVIFKSAGTNIVAAQRVLASTSIGAGLSRKNYILNGAMMVSQENGTADINPVPFGYAADQFPTLAASSSGTMHVQQTASVTPAGSPYRYRFAASPVNTSPAAGDYVFIRQVLEGLRIADLRFGSSSAKTVTLQFGVKAPTGTYCVCFRNFDNTRVYVAEYAISAGENLIDTVKSITIVGDTSGTWKADNLIGVTIDWITMAGSSNKGATAGVWSGTNLVATNNQINAALTTSGFELFDVSLTEGTVAPPFQVPDYASELAACRRYYAGIYTNMIVSGYNATSAANYTTVYFSVPMRANPTFVPSAISYTNCSNLAADSTSTTSAMLHAVVGSTGNSTVAFSAAFNARL